MLTGSGVGESMNELRNGAHPWVNESSRAWKDNSLNA